MPQIVYVSHDGQEITVNVPTGETVMRGALYNDVEGIAGECGGGLSCATCHCYIDDAWLERVGEPLSDIERELLESAASAVKPTSRLSCQITVTDAMDGLIIYLPETQYA